METKRKGRPPEYTQEQADEVVRLVGNVSYREIALRLGITLGKVQRILKARGGAHD